MRESRRILTVYDYFAMLLALLAGSAVGVVAIIVVVVILDVFLIQYEFVLAWCGVALLCIQMGAGTVLMTTYQRTPTKVAVMPVVWGVGLYWFVLCLWIGLSVGIVGPNAPAWLIAHGAGFLFVAILASGGIPALVARLWKRRRRSDV